MKISETYIKDLLIFEPQVFKDERGYFFESFRSSIFESLNPSFQFVQDNQSLSAKHVLRGLHLQLPPHVQGKLVRVVKGSVFDVAVDLRKRSKTFTKWFGIELSASNKKMLWVPPGFAHGFLSLEDDTVFTYKCTAYYNKESERGIHWNDPQLAIEWPVKDPILTTRDNDFPLLDKIIEEIQFGYEK